MTTKKVMTSDDVIVVDDFYSDPHAVRKLALGVKYVHVPEYNVAAMQSIEAFYSDSMVQRIGDYVGGRVSFDQEDAAFGKFRMMYKNATARLHIHNDRHPWAGILYLTPDELSRGGTGFFWHKESGFSGPPEDPELRPEHGIASRESFEEIVVRDSLDLSCWEMFHLVPFKFNRLVLFRGSKFFHGTFKRFGDSPSNGRLTQNFFFSLDTT
jgi:hypothetical protein